MVKATRFATDRNANPLIGSAQYTEPTSLCSSRLKNLGIVKKRNAVNDVGTKQLEIANMAGRKEFINQENKQ